MSHCPWTHRSLTRLFSAPRFALRVALWAVLLGGFFSLGSTAAASPDVSISGRWKILVGAEGHQRDYYVEFKQDGNKVSGTFISPRSGNYPFEGGSFADGKLAFKVERKSQEGTSVWVVDALLKDSGKFEGTVDIEGQKAPIVLSKAGNPVVGKWKAVSKTPQGQEHPSTLEFSEDPSGALKGKSTSVLGTVDLTSVSLDGDKFTFEIVLPIDGNNIPFVVNASLKDANTLSGRWKTKEADISGEWSATREAPPAAAPAPKQAPAAAEASKALAGKWFAVATLPEQKKTNFQMDLQLDGEKLKGKLEMSKGSLEIQHGTASGEKVEFSVTYHEESGDIVVKLDGELKNNGEVLSGKWTSAAGERGEWSARKATSL